MGKLSLPSLTSEDKEMKKIIAVLTLIGSSYVSAATAVVPAEISNTPAFCKKFATEMHKIAVHRDAGGELSDIVDLVNGTDASDASKKAYIRGAMIVYNMSFATPKEIKNGAYSGCLENVYE